MVDDGNTNKDNDEREDDYDIAKLNHSLFIRMPPAVNDTKMCFGVMVWDLMIALARWGVTLELMMAIQISK